MSWSDYFPIFSEKDVALYVAEATKEEKSEINDFFAIDEIHNKKQNVAHIVSTSLFWKRDYIGQRDLETISEAAMKDPSGHGIQSRFVPWDHYVVPILEGARLLAKERKDVVLRVYLASDLEFLVKVLVDSGCEVAKMKSSSIRHNPGAMWRFLALEDEDAAITVTDSDRLKTILSDIGRTEALRITNLEAWRVPYCIGLPNGTTMCENYRPMRAAQFGSLRALPVRAFMEAFVWHSIRGNLPIKCDRGTSRERLIIGTRWPDYGFDEWFLLAAIYPHLAAIGLATFSEWSSPPDSPLFALDIEYATWVNPSSELIYYDASDIA